MENTLIHAATNLLAAIDNLNSQQAAGVDYSETKVTAARILVQTRAGQLRSSLPADSVMSNTNPLGEQSPQKHYECFVTESQHYRNDDNYPTSRDESWLVTSADLDALYDKLAQVKVRETPEEERGYEYTTVSFGDIREIAVLSVVDVDDQRLEQTPAWQKHDQERREEQARKEQAAAARVANKEAEERAELARLQAKYAT